MTACSRSRSAVRQLPRDAHELGERHEHEEPAGQRHVGRDAGALRAHRVLEDLHDDLLARLTAAAISRDAALHDVVSVDDLVDVEEGVLLQPDVDEGRLHARQDVPHAAE